MLHIYGIVQTHTEYVVAWYGTIVISINLLCLVFFFFFACTHNTLQKTSAPKHSLK